MCAVLKAAAPHFHAGLHRVRHRARDSTQELADSPCLACIFIHSRSAVHEREHEAPHAEL